MRSVCEAHMEKHWLVCTMGFFKEEEEMVVWKTKKSRSVSGGAEGSAEK